ncbi:ABC transporter permease [Pedobacter sp. UYP1]|jgi:putative ABC transport system permease protein|uniref:ABC transporter permease n=1 Tax=Pedobacter sp. UYP1 TaxID=1756396 RepID=UPI003396EE52
MFRLNLKIALRNLWKNKGFTLINVGGLGIGLASCMILLLYVNYEWGYDKQFDKHEDTYVVYQNVPSSGKIFSWAWTPNVMAQEVREKIPGVEAASHSTYPNSNLITYGTQKIKGAGIFTDPSFLKILNYKFIKGNPNAVLRNVNSIILTRSFSLKLFGNEDPINKTVKLANTELLKVEGIIEDVPANSSIQFQYLMTWNLYEKREPWVRDRNWGNNICLTLVQLKSQAVFEQANSQIKDIYQRNLKASTGKALLFPIDKWHLYDEFVNGKSIGGKIDQLKIFILLAVCILMIACVNFMNLSTANSEKRAKEVGVRKAIGSSRKSLIGQFLLESLILAGMSTMLAFLLTEISLPYFNQLLDLHLIIQYDNWNFWLILIAMMVFTGLIAGSYPALYLSSFEPVKVLKGLNGKAGNAVSIRKVLVVFQFVFAVCTIICTAVIYQQLSFIKEKPIGYDRHNLIQLTVQGNLENENKLNLLKDKLLKSGAATSVSFFSHDISEGGNNTMDVEWPGKDINQDVIFNQRGVGYDFIKTIGTELIAGREFSAKFPNDSTHMMLNESAVKTIGLKEPLGKVIEWNNKHWTVVGIVKDFIVESAYEKAAPMIFYPIKYSGAATVLIRLDPASNLASSLNKIDKSVQDIEPSFPVDRKFVNESFALKFKNEQLLGTLSNWFGGFAIFISCLGLLGLALFMAEQRKREISIRKVLGASTVNILTLLNKDFIKLVAIANIIAFPLAYVIVNKWLSAFEYRVSISALPFILAICLSVLVAILTVSLQSVKVAKANPIDALKYE